MRKANILWKELINEAKNLPRSTSKADFYNFLCKWIIKNQMSIGKENVEGSRLIELTKLNPNNYALEHTELEVTSIINWMEKSLPDKNNSLAMFLRSYLEELIIFHIEQKCSNNCSSYNLEVRKNDRSENPHFFYVCPLCYLAQLSNGEPFNESCKPKDIKIANKFDLKEAKLI